MRYDKHAEALPLVRHVLLIERGLLDKKILVLETRAQQASSSSRCDKQDESQTAKTKNAVQEGIERLRADFDAVEAQLQKQIEGIAAQASSQPLVPDFRDQTLEKDNEVRHHKEPQQNGKTDDPSVNATVTPSPTCCENSDHADFHDAAEELDEGEAGQRGTPASSSVEPVSESTRRSTTANKHDLVGVTVPEAGVGFSTENDDAHRGEGAEGAAKSRYPRPHDKFVGRRILSWSTKIQNRARIQNTKRTGRCRTFL